MDSDNLTWDDLRELIEALPPERRKDDVTIFVRGVDEYYPIAKTRFASNSDVLDDGHLFLVV